MKIKCSVSAIHHPFAEVVAWHLKIMNKHNIIADKPFVFFNQVDAFKFRDNLMLEKSGSDLISHETRGSTFFSLYLNKNYDTIDDLLRYAK